MEYYVTNTADIIKPGITRECFKLVLDGNWFNVGDIVTSGRYTGLIINNPCKKWYKLLLQLITFGWYKAPYQYKIKTK